MRGLPADGVRRVPLLQRHEEVRRAGTNEAVLHHEAVHRCEYKLSSVHEVSSAVLLADMRRFTNLLDNNKKNLNIFAKTKKKI